MILIPLYRFLVLGKASHIFSRKKLVVEITFSLFHHDVSIGPCVSIWEVFDQAACWECVWSIFSKFRIVPVTQFLQHFASDRSHMVCFLHAIYYDCWTIWSWWKLQDYPRICLPRRFINPSADLCQLKRVLRITWCRISCVWAQMVIMVEYLVELKSRSGISNHVTRFELIAFVELSWILFCFQDFVSDLVFTQKWARLHQHRA